MRFVVDVGGWTRIPALRGLEDFFFALVSALRALGHEVHYPYDPESSLCIFDRLILFNAGAVPSSSIPEDAILFNTEQVSAKQQWDLAPHVEAAKRRVVWDYSERNVAWWREHGCERVVHCPVGYVPSMTRIDALPPEKEDVDVLFYGALNDRRKAILDEVEAAGLKVERLLGVFGIERDRAIARAKVVLNLHFYLDPVFEIFRVSHLLANRKCVVSEDGGQDPAIEYFATRACMVASRDKIAATCRSIVTDSSLRRALATQGFTVFKQTDLVENVRLALEQS